MKSKMNKIGPVVVVEKEMFSSVGETFLRKNILRTIEVIESCKA